MQENILTSELTFNDDRNISDTETGKKKGNVDRIMVNNESSSLGNNDHIDMGNIISLWESIRFGG